MQFRNGEEVTLYYTLVKEHGGWKVEDIADQQGEEPWSLSALLGDAQLGGVERAACDCRQTCLWAMAAPSETSRVY